MDIQQKPKVLTNIPFRLHHHRRVSTYPGNVPGSLETDP